MKAVPILLLALARFMPFAVAIAGTTYVVFLLERISLGGKLVAVAAVCALVGAARAGLLEWDDVTTECQEGVLAALQSLAETDDVLMADLKTLYPRWDDAPFRLEPRVLRLDPFSRPMQVTADWDCMLGRGNALAPGRTVLGTLHCVAEVQTHKDPDRAGWTGLQLRPATLVFLPRDSQPGTTTTGRSSSKPQKPIVPQLPETIPVPL